MPDTYLQDTVSFTQTVERTVVSDTVKVTVQVKGMVNSNTDDADLRAKIRAALSTFIAAEWSLSNLTRTSEMQMEKVFLSASTRVNETENKALEDRARAATSPGLEISVSEVDNSIPQRLISVAEIEMRSDIIRAALAHCNTLDSIIPQVSVPGSRGAVYRIHSVDFHPARQEVATNKRAYATALAFNAAGSEMGGSTSGDAAIGNAQKFTMTANIVAARLVLYPLPGLA